MSPSQHKRTYPKAGQVYSLLQISKMPLDDSPALMVKIEGEKTTVQNSHVCDELMFKNCPELAASLWRYIKTTDEWIPVFEYAGNSDNISKLFDWEVYRDPYRSEHEKPGWWLTPKGSPREQYYGEDMASFKTFIETRGWTIIKGELQAQGLCRAIRNNAATDADVTNWGEDENSVAREAFNIIDDEENG